MTRFLLDTNHMSEAIRSVSRVRDRIQQAGRGGSRFATCWPVLCELEEGIIQTADPSRYRRKLRTILADVRIWPMDWPLIRRFAELSQSLKSRGRALSHVDVVLASMAWNEEAILLTSDADFLAIPELRIENWLA